MPEKHENGVKGPQIRRRERWVALPEEYEGFEFQVWVNAPARLWTTAVSPETDEAERIDALSKIVIGHNNWLDYDGRPFPSPSEAKFWEEIPTELAACVIASVQNEMARLPNSLAPQQRRSGRG